MNKFYKVDLAADGWGLLVNEGSADDPKFRVLLKGSERWMERMATEMNNGSPGLQTQAQLAHVMKATEEKRHD